MLIWYMNAKIIIGRVLKMLVAEIGCSLQAAEKRVRQRGLLWGGVSVNEA